MNVHNDGLNAELLKFIMSSFSHYLIVVNVVLG